MKKSISFWHGFAVIFIFLFLIGFAYAEDVGTGRIIIDKDKIVKIKGNDYNVNAGSLFIIKNDELAEGTSFVAGKNGGIFRLKGVNVKLPENTKVLFKDGKIKIELPDGVKLDTLNVKELEKAKGVKFEFVSKDKGFNLPSGDLFKGILNYDIDKNGIGNLYFSDKEAVLDGLKVKNPKQERIDLDLKGEVSKSYSGNYISIDSRNSKLVIGKNSNGAGVRVEKQGENVVFRAGKDDGKDAGDKAGKGTIVIENSKVKTYGDYRIDNGELSVETGINKKGEKTLIMPSDVNKNGKKSSRMEIASYDNDGKLLLKSGKKVVINENNGLEVYSINNAVQDASEEKPRVTFNTQESPQTAQVQNSESNNPASGLKLGILSPVNRGYNPSNSVYEDILGHSQTVTIYGTDKGGQATTLHENEHGANAEATIKAIRDLSASGNPDKWNLDYVSGYYLGNNQYAVLLEPGLDRKQIYKNYVPNELINKGYTTNYFTDDDGIKKGLQRAENSNYIHDEWMAGIKEFEGSMQLIDRNQWTSGVASRGQQGIGVMDTGELAAFTTNSLAVATAVREQNPNYWNNHPEYRSFVAVNLIKSKQLYDAATSSKYNGYFLNNHNNYFQTLRTGSNPAIEKMRETARQVLGSDASKRVLGF
ncbi:MAG: hypothetical protein AABX54_00730 [Nanoarchaeota archaeon]